MNILKTIKNRFDRNLTIESRDDGFSLVEGVVSIGIITTVALVGVNSTGGYNGLIDNAKQVQTSSLVRDVMTNIVFYELDGDVNTDANYAVNEFNKVNSEKGFTAYSFENNDCVAVQIVSDNGLNTIDTNGVNCDSLVIKLNEIADNLKPVEEPVDDLNKDTELIDDNVVVEFVKTVFTEWYYFYRNFNKEIEMFFNKKRFNDNGFTLIELVVAVGIVVILSVSGMVAYSSFIYENRLSAMELTATAVMNNGLSYVADYDDNTDIEMAVEEFNDKKYNKDFFVSTSVDEDNCVNIIVSDLTNKVEENIVKSNDKFCNLSKEEIGWLFSNIKIYNN